ncbi:hypothetical protein RI129_006987 [Pyrocoelia pectoralis]|uniref:Uncharacterized protein n=1 Tax=Pyrocoelia pectoralis TaxID=417401 RepID=A0AAN7ZGP8_9COLE
MNSFVIVFACLVACASAKPSGLWGHGHHLPLIGASGVVSGYGAAGPAGIVTGHGAVGPLGIHSGVGHVAHVGHVLAHGHDDGQWHGEGLLESQDWAGHGAHVVGAHGIAVGHGLALGHGLAHAHGAVVAGPAGAIVAHSHPGAVYGHHHGHW